MPGGFEMVCRVSRVVGIVVCICTVFAVSPVVAQQGGSGEAAPTSNEELSDEDQLLPGIYDPDDDDDGVPDEIDSHPDDPTKGENPPPGPADPIADDDGDGLPNLMDPDDNNDGVVDEDEPRGVPDQQAGESDSAAPETGGTNTNPQAAASGSSGRPVALALPNTGSGPVPDAGQGSMVMISLTVLLASGGVLLRETRQRS